ncbi:pentatricopeptide repeat-containing protein At1g15480, mitochondrial [Capsella rubella]|uniref:pentatricopeptide repeat-containing protein At1g15480, mitochondrial n=1 Tax=Capsella rubella TaxID=81985 RepID=UPI000CD5A74F|nr:pentatricopeptide repeat-containing protein At1g15480, mitochondrial [Capsella rubella]
MASGPRGSSDAVLRQRCLKDFHDFHQFRYALEASEWMCEEKVFNIFSKDYADRLQLVDIVLGLEETEKFFKTIPENMRDYSVYDSLLTCYAKSPKTLDKAEATFEKMRDLGFLFKPSPFQSMINLYGRVNKKHMVKKLEREAIENNVHMNKNTDVLSLCRTYKGGMYSVLNHIKKRGKMMDDECLSRISYLLEINDLQGAEKLFEEWKPVGTELDIRIPNLLISRFSAEGNRSKVVELVDSTRRKMVEMHLWTLKFWSTVLVFSGGLLVTVGYIVGCNVWLLREYPIISVPFCLYLVLKHPIMFGSLCYYVVTR